MAETEQAQGELCSPRGRKKGNELYINRPYDPESIRKLHGTRMTGDKITEAALPALREGEGARLLAEELAWLKENKVWETYDGSR